MTWGWRWASKQVRKMRVARGLAVVARRHGARKIALTVNKGNRLALAVYERLGFRKAGAPVTDIGGGFVMDDYRLERSV